MNYLITESVGEGIYWRHQLTNVTAEPWQNIQASQIANQVHSISEDDRLVVIITDALVESDSFSEIESAMNQLNQQGGCICWIVQDESVLQRPQMHALRVSYAACAFVEGQDHFERLEQILYRPIGILQETKANPMSGVTITHQLEATQPLGKRKGEADFALKPKNTWWQRSRREKTPTSSIRARGCMSVMGSSLVASELAMTASEMGIKTVLVDLDRFKPSLDFMFDVEAQLPYGHQRLDQYHTTGLNVLLDSARFKQLEASVVEKCCIKVKGQPLLRVVTGVYDLAEIEYFRSEDLEAIVHLLLNANDLVILLSSPFLYDGFTLKAMHLSKLILQVLPKELAGLRGYNQQLKLLKEKQRIAYSRQVWMTVGSEGESPALGAFSKLGLGTFMGNVNLSQEEVACLMEGNAYFKKQSYVMKCKPYEAVLRRLSEEG